MKFDLILPVHNFVDLTRIMLTCVRNSSIRPENIFLIDNASTDSTELLPREYQDLSITYIKNDTNIGVNPAWNQGFELIESEVVGIINNDIEFPPYVFELLLDALSSWDKLGMVHPRRTERTAFEVSKPHNPVIDTGHGIQGFCMFMKTSLWKSIGPIPKELIIFYGDDYLRNLTVEKGLYLATVVNAPMFHHEGATVYGSHEDRQWKDMDTWRMWCDHKTMDRDTIIKNFSEKKFCDMPNLELFVPYKNFYEEGIELAVGQKSKVRVVELGSEVGLSARLFLEKLKTLGVDYELTFVDPTLRMELEALIDNEKTFFVEAKAEEVSGQFFDVDLLHIDVDPHAYEQTKQLLDLYLPTMNSDGVVLLHDASPVKFGVNKALLELDRPYSVTFCEPSGRFPEAAPAMITRED